jgi:hypothetical protein
MTTAMIERRWRFQSLATGYEKVRPLWLYPEIDCSSCVDDADDQSGEGQPDYYIDYVQRRYPHWWEADAVPIWWFVMGEHICEFAPMNAHRICDGKNFLTEFTAPVDAKTGEPMNWWRLPVRNTRFPTFAKALGWLPSPFQEFAPLRSIITNATAKVNAESAA